MSSIRELLNLIAKKPGFFVVSLACFVSALGSAFTSIVILAEFEKAKVPALFYSLVLVCGLVPALFTSQMAGLFMRRTTLVLIPAVATLLAAFLMFVPLLALSSKNYYLLFIAAITASAAAGFLAPIVQTLTRKLFSDNELRVVSVYDSIVFTAQYIFGHLVGSMLYSAVGSEAFIAFDIVTYFAASALLFTVYSRYGSQMQLAPVQKVTTGFWKDCSSYQKRIFVLLPLLSLICAPLMSVLPKYAESLDHQFSFFTLGVSAVLMTVLARTAGQVLGPFLVLRFNFDKILSRPRTFYGLIAIYILLYLAAFQTQSLLAICALVITAHVSSNMLYVVASYAFSKNFSEELISRASPRHYQASVISVVIGALLGGFVADTWGLPYVFVLSMGFLLLFFAVNEFSLAKKELSYEL